MRINPVQKSFSAYIILHAAFGAKRELGALTPGLEI
jgi:hypothetical protein